MLKKNYFVLFLVISTLLVAGCSSKKKKRKATPTGSVVFFQNIEGTGTLQLQALNTNERNSYGSVAFEQFTSAVNLNVGEWQVAIKQNKTGDSQNTEELAQGKFSVGQNKISLVAITGEEENASVLPLKFAERQGERSINVSHLYSDLGAIDIYFQAYQSDLNCEDEAAFDEPAQILLLEAQQTSESIVLPIEDDEKAICIQIKSGGDVVFQSGKVVLEDGVTQTLLLSKNTSPLAQEGAINLLYYAQGSVAVWSDIADQVAQVRVLNLFENDAITGTKFTMFPQDEDKTSYPVDDTTLGAIRGLSDSVEVAANVSYFLEADNGLPAPLISPFSGQLWTVAYFNEDEPKTIKISEMQNVVKDRSQLMISAPLVAGTYDASSYKVYMLKPSETALNEASASLSPRSSVLMDLEPSSYQVVVTDGSESDVVKLAEYSLELEAEENYHLMLYKEGGGFSLCLIREDDNECAEQ